jgi:hypothetical protein
LCGTFRNFVTTISAMMPIGTFTRNTQRQPSIPATVPAPAKKPPTTGPATLEMPQTPMK